jgi:hypothetical protein
MRTLCNKPIFGYATVNLNQAAQSNDYLTQSTYIEATFLPKLEAFLNNSDFKLNTNQHIGVYQLDPKAVAPYKSRQIRINNGGPTNFITCIGLRNHSPFTPPKGLENNNTDPQLAIILEDNRTTLNPSALLKKGKVLDTLLQQFFSTTRAIKKAPTQAWNIVPTSKITEGGEYLGCVPQFWAVG